MKKTIIVACGALLLCGLAFVLLSVFSPGPDPCDILFEQVVRGLEKKSAIIQSGAENLPDNRNLSLFMEHSRKISLNLKECCLLFHADKIDFDEFLKCQDDYKNFETNIDNIILLFGQAAEARNQGQADLNEDARVQLRNLLKQQVKIGLMNRRDVVRYNQNIIEEDEQQVVMPQQEAVQQSAQQYLDRIEQRLSEKDRHALEIVANKMIDQQAAAAGVVTAIRVAMPEHGQRLNFKRPLQTDPTEPLTVSFKVGRGGKLRSLLALWPAFILFGLTWYGWSRRKDQG